MKMKSILFCALFLSFTSGLTVKAEENIERQDGPCKKIMDACKVASESAKSKNVKLSIYKDCFQPLLTDKTVADVSIAPADLKACKEKREASKKKAKSP